MAFACLRILSQMSSCCALVLALLCSRASTIAFDDWGDVDLPEPAGSATHEADWPYKQFRYPADSELDGNKVTLPIMVFSPITESTGFNPGWSWSTAAIMMVDIINRESNLLPGFQLQAVIGDGRCSRDDFMKEYFVWLTNSSNWFGLIGPGCFGSTSISAALTTDIRLVAISQSTNPQFVDRNKYPYFFRSIVPDSDFPFGWAALCNIFGWTQVMVVVSSLAAGKMEELMQLAMLGAGVAIRTTVRYEKSADAMKVIDNVETHKTRIIVAGAWADEIRTIMCAAHSFGLRGLIYMTYGWFGGPWWKRGDLEALGCSANNMTLQAQSALQTNAQFYNPNARAELTCWPGRTAQDFKDAWHAKVGSNLWDEGTTMADAVCLLAKVLSEFLVIRGVSHQSLVPPWHVSDALWQDMNSYLQDSQIEGASASLRFRKNSGDPEGNLVITQVQGDVKVLIGTMMHNRTITWTEQRLRWLDGSLQPPPDSFPVCAQGIYDFLTALCRPCPLGMVFVASTSSCICDFGYRTIGKDGQQSCEACELGKFADSQGAISCTNCFAGMFARTIGSSGCLKCDTGRYETHGGSSQCAGCPIAGTTTMKSLLVAGIEQWVLFDGATSNESCVCEPGSYLSGEGHCSSCHEGMQCIGGDVLIQAGYYSDVDISVYKCSGESQRCKGGKPGHTCMDGRHGIACSECNQDMTPSDDGSCHPCSGSDVVPLAACIFFVFTVIVIAYFVIGSVPAVPSSGLMVSGITLGQFIALVQVLGVISTFSIEFRPPLDHVLKTMTFLTLDVELMRLNCVYDATALYRFVIKVLSIVIVSLAVLIIHVCVVVFKYRGDFKGHFPTLIAIVGSVFTVFYIAVTNAVMGPFQCEQHPNGKWTVRSASSVICWVPGTHTAMLVVASIAAFLPVSYLVKCCHLVWKFPKRMMAMDMNFFKSYSFLFIRVQPNAYWYSILLLNRSLVISSLPIVPDPAVQIGCLQLILMVMLCVTAWFHPWRALVSNYIDIAIAGLTILFISLAALFVRDEDADADALSFMLTWSLISFLGCLPCIILLGLYSSFSRSRKKYQFFICHHKRGTGAYARALHLFLVDLCKSGKTVFFDSDNLDNLGDLLSCVASQVDCLVVLASKSIFSRPWCLGEITTAYLKKVEIRLVRMPDFEGLDEKVIIGIDSSIEGINAVASSGIGIGHIQAALQLIRELPMISVPVSLNVAAIIELTQKLNSAPENCTIRIVSEDVIESPDIILCDAGILDVSAAAIVLSKMLYASQMVFATLALGQSIPSCTQRAVILFSNGCLQSRVLATWLLEADSQKLQMVPLIIDDTFEAPTGALLQELRDHPVVPVTRAGLLADIVRDIFQEIAKNFFASRASKTELLTASQHLADRIRNHKKPSFTRISTLTPHHMTNSGNMVAASSTKADFPATYLVDL